jgi:outer membrane protein OmpA-like peptidoglycan-associated protein
MGSAKLITECKGARPEMIKCGAPNRRVEVEPITITKK